MWPWGLAVGSHGELVAEDELLPLLHDADAEVCRCCELALHAGDSKISTSFWPGSSAMKARRRVWKCCSFWTVPAIWTRNLAAPVSARILAAVRAAAVRAAAGQNVVDLRDRLLDMAQNGRQPNGATELAGAYLRFPWREWPAIVACRIGLHFVRAETVRERSLRNRQVERTELRMGRPGAPLPANWLHLLLNPGSLHRGLSEGGCPRLARHHYYFPPGLTNTSRKRKRRFFAACSPENRRFWLVRNLASL